MYFLLFPLKHLSQAFSVLTNYRTWLRSQLTVMLSSQNSSHGSCQNPVSENKTLYSLLHFYELKKATGEMNIKSQRGKLPEFKTISCLKSNQAILAENPEAGNRKGTESILNEFVD